MAVGHDSTKTSIFIDGLFYNIDKVPQTLVNANPEVARALLRYMMLRYPKKEVATFEESIMKDD